jgi:hypothetical protein
VTKPDIYIAIPNGRDWKRAFGISMVGLIMHLTKMVSKGTIKGFRFDTQQTSNLPKLRQSLLDNALKSGCTHILFIDDDTEFPADAVETMLSRGKPWVTVNICRKVLGAGWIARYDADKGGGVVDSFGRTGIEKVGTMGLGMALIELDPIRHIPAPHFEMVWVNERAGYLGEDLYFLLKCRKEAGIDIWVDHDVSNRVSHVGDYGFGAQDFIQFKAEDAA